MGKYIACIDESLTSTVILILKAKTYNDALKEIKKEIIGEFDGEVYEDGYINPEHGYVKLNHVMLYEISHEVKLPIEQWYSEMEKRIQSVKKKEEKDCRRIKYEVLKKEFGDE